MVKTNILCPSSELIYEEVIDWEERNKNGVLKEDCSGMILWGLFISRCVDISSWLIPFMCHASDVVSSSASQSSSANDISSMSTEHTVASDTDSSSIDTLTGPLDDSQWTQRVFLILTSIWPNFPPFQIVDLLILFTSELVSDCCFKIKICAMRLVTFLTWWMMHALVYQEHMWCGRIVVGSK